MENIQKSVTFTSDDLHTLFEIGEDLDSIHDNIIKCDAIADIFTEAIARFSETGQSPKEGVIQSVVNVIFDYSRKATDTIENTCKRFSQLYTQKRNESYGEVG